MQQCLRYYKTCLEARGSVCKGFAGSLGLNGCGKEGSNEPGRTGLCAQALYIKNQGINI
jgi:hypothetical protein